MKSNDIKVAFTFVGAIVGAGFASGQELVRFFVGFGYNGLKGVVVAGLGFAVIGALVIILVNKIKAEDYGGILLAIFPLRVVRIFDLLIFLTLWLGLGIMLTGSSTLIEEQLNLPVILGFLGTLLLIYFSLLFGNQGLLMVNTVLVPILIVLAIGSSVFYLLKPLECTVSLNFENVLPNWWVASLLYVAYNMILGIVVLASIGGENKKISAAGGILGGLILGCMAWIMVKGLIFLPENLQKSEMPMVLMTLTFHPVIGLLYSFGLWVALFTTAIANAHSLTKRIKNKTHQPYRKILVIILISTFCFLPWKFSFLVGVIYPLLGYIGLPVIVGVLMKIFKLIAPRRLLK